MLLLCLSSISRLVGSFRRVPHAIFGPLASASSRKTRRFHRPTSGSCTHHNGDGISMDKTNRFSSTSTLLLLSPQCNHRVPPYQPYTGGDAKSTAPSLQQPLSDAETRFDGFALTRLEWTRSPSAHIPFGVVSRTLIASQEGRKCFTLLHSLICTNRFQALHSSSHLMVVK
jgi:hypothetical protein